MNEFDELYATILKRKQAPEGGSYTNYLLDKGTEKICKKLGEEATEVVIAACMQDQKELIEEISDLTYHMFVLMVSKGVTLEDVQAELACRAKKEHNLKPERRPIEQL